MPKTPRSVSTAPSTFSRPPSGSTTPVSMSVSMPVIALDSALTSSSVSGISSVPLSAFQPESITAEPLLSGGQSDCDLFQKLNFTSSGRRVRILRVVLLLPFLPLLRLWLLHRVRFILLPLLPSRVRIILHAPIWVLVGLALF